MIQKNWKELIKPNKLDIEPGDDPSRTATVVAEPLERGFGSDPRQRVAAGAAVVSLQGAAVTSIQIDGVLHEFSSIPACARTSRTSFSTSSRWRCACTATGRSACRLKAEGPGEVTAAQIETGA